MPTDFARILTMVGLVKALDPPYSLPVFDKAVALGVAESARRTVSP